MADAGPRADDLPTLREQLAQVTKERDEALSEAKILLDGMDVLCVALLGESEQAATLMLARIAELTAAEARLSALQAQIAAIEQYAQELRSSTIAKPRGAFGRFKLKVADTLSQIAGTHERGKEVR